MPDGTRRHLAEMQMRRQARRPLLGRQVALHVIAGQQIGQLADLAQRLRLAGRPVRIEIGRPVGRGRAQRPLLQRIALRPPGGCGDRVRRGPRLGRWQMRLQRLPEGGIDSERRAAAGADLLHPGEVIAIVQAQRIAQLRIDPPPPGFVLDGGMDGRRAGLLHQRPQFGQRIAPAQHQPAALLRQGLAQPLQDCDAATSAARRRSAIRPAHRRPGYRPGRPPLVDRRQQRRMIVQPQILSEPQQDRLGWIGVAHRRTTRLARCRSATGRTIAPGMSRQG